MRIALWGFYAYGNFGDDLVAGLLASFVREQCHADTTAYKLCEPYARHFGVAVSNDLDELIAGADLLIFGGSSILESSLPPRQGFGTAAKLPGHSADSARVLELTREHAVPIVGISIGGDGVYPRQLHPPSKREFLERARYISVRYADDVRLLEENHKQGDCFPDLLWQAPTVVAPERERHERLRIGVNLYAGQLLPQRAFSLPAALYAAALRRRDIDWLFIDSANRSHNSFRALPCLPGVRGSNYMFEQPAADLAKIASLDMLITTQTPLAIVALSYGIPTLVLAPDGRSQRLLRDIEAPQLAFAAGDARRLWSLLTDRARLSAFVQQFRLAQLEELRSRSREHLDRLATRGLPLSRMSDCR